MSDEIGNVPPPVGEPLPEQPWTTTSYTPPPPPPGYVVPPAGYVPPPPPVAGLSDTAAGAVAYLTFIPAVIFLLIEPYKSRPFVKFHAIQELGLTVVGFAINLVFRLFLFHIPILGALVWFGCWAVLFVIWLLCVLKASQGGLLRLPFLSAFAAQQSGYVF